MLLLVVVVHGLLLLNDGIYWDDWLTYSQMAANDWSTISTIANELGGFPTYLYFWWSFKLFPDPVIATKFVVFGLISVWSLLLLAVCKRSGFLTRTEALMITCLAVTYPGFQTWILLSTANYVLFYVLFLAATWMLLLSEEPAPAGAQIAKRVGSLALYLLSFSLASLLVLYLAVLLLLVLRRLAAGAGITSLARFALARVDFILAPPIYWIVSRQLFPPHGVFSYYHQFDLSPRSLVDTSLAFVRWSIWGQLIDSLVALGSQPVVWLLVLFVLQQVWMRRGTTGTAERPERPTRVMLGFGALVLVLACAPYVLVGDAPALHGWSTRHAILVGLPIAIIVVAFSGIVFPGAQQGFGLLGWVVSLSLLAGFSLATISDYLSWEVRSVKDQSLMVNLSRDPIASRYSLYWVDDRFPAGGEPAYRFYEWSSMFNQIWGGEDRIGVDVRDPASLDSNRPLYTHRYAAGRFDPAGCQATLVIDRGPRGQDDFGLVARYLLYRFFEPGKLEQLFIDATTVEVRPLSSPLATDCHLP